MSTQAERNHMWQVAQLSCIVCGARPIEVHHIKRLADGSKVGFGQRGDHFRVIPLCHAHHWNGAWNPMGSREFERLYGNELELLERTYEALGLPYPFERTA